MGFISVLKRPQQSYCLLVTIVGLFTAYSIVNESSFYFLHKDKSRIETSYDEYNCGCPRFGRVLSRDEREEGSLCSDWSTIKGEGQDVVSYSIYGGQNKNIFHTFYGQIEDRIREAGFYYPEWRVRLYHNTSRDGESNILKLLCNLYCKYPQFDLCDVNKIYIPPSWNMSRDDVLKSKNYTMDINGLIRSVLKLMQEPKFKEEFLNLNKIGEDQLTSNSNEALQNPTALKDEYKSSLPESMDKANMSFSNLLVGKMWRFVVMGDPYVNKFLVRDIDSYILPREVAAVTQWSENSTAPTHSMRDHPSHNGYILAGLWGGSRTRGGDTLKGLFQKMLCLPLDHSPWYDQQVLKDIVWPAVGKQMLIHDSYHCRNPIISRTTIPRPFPTKRRGHMFVSWGPFRPPNELNIIKPCPLACRPREHSEWTFC